MKKSTLPLLASLWAMAAVAPLGAQDIKINLDPNKPAVAAPAAPAAATKFTDEQKLEVWGFMVAQQLGLTELGFSAIEVNAVAKGMALAVQGREPTYNAQEIMPQVEALLKSRADVARARQEKVLGAMRDQNKKEADAFLATLKGKPGIVELPSGLRYEILQQGKGPKPKATQMVKANYKGTFISGDEFDSSERGGKPAEFALNKVIAGFAEGLQLIQQGGKIKLYVPANLAYGDTGSPPVIQPGSLLIFEIEVLEVFDAPKEAPAK